jgi:alpha-L-rhamnosidase
LGHPRLAKRPRCRLTVAGVEKLVPSVTDIQPIIELIDGPVPAIVPRPVARSATAGARHTTVVSDKVLRGKSGILHPSMRPAVPTDLRVEHDPSPRTVHRDRPRFSWRIDAIGEQRAYRVLVARSREVLGREEGDVWDSGRVADGESVDVVYDGLPLSAGERYHWMVRVWNDDGDASTWSDPATFATAPDGFDGEWIGHQPDGGDSAGFRTRWRPADDAGDAWVQVDLGAPTAFGTVELYPADPITGPTTPDGITVASSGWELDSRFGFPAGVRIEACEDASFEEPRVLTDTDVDAEYRELDEAFTTGDGEIEPYAVDVGDATARYVRVVASEPWVFEPPSAHGVDTRRDDRAWAAFALAAVAVRAPDGTDRAIGRRVRASSSAETEAWGRDRLVDGSYRSAFASESPLLRTELDLSAPIAAARIHVASLGYGELYVNGERVGDAVLDPGWTDYRKRVLYRSHDVTDELRAGENALGVWLGRGWYTKGAALWTSLASPRARLQLDVEYADGRTRRLTSGADWRATDGPVRENDIYDGEVYDARAERTGWTEPGFDDSSWTPAAPVSAPDGRLYPQQAPPIRVVETLEPVDVGEHGEGFIVDFGQNHTGWLELAVEGADAGDEITIRYAEALDEDGGLATVDLRSADATDVYVARGDDRETYAPRFTYHGYRFARVTGYPGELTVDDVRSKVVHTDLPSIGEFRCANDDLERVNRNARWGLRSNAHSVPTDCPQRDERLGWTGDAQLAGRSLMYNFDARGFYEKWLRDHTDAQAAAGYLPSVVPQANTVAPSDPAWTVTRVVLPWYLYVHYGDEAVLEDHYAEMRRYVEYWHSVADDGIVPAAYGRYGDWVAMENTDGNRGLPFALFNTAHHFETTRLFGEIADVLGYDADAALFADRADAVADAFNDRFLDAPNDRYEPDTQAASAVPLFYGIAPPDRRREIAATLAGKVREDGGLRTGFLGTRAIVHALAEYGQIDTAYGIVSRPERPGWVYMVEQGATTVWERWDSDDQVGSGMNSLNHSPFTLVSEWFYRALAGIRFDRAFGERRRVTIAPKVPTDLGWAGASVRTPYGEVASRWDRTERDLQVQVEVPWNVTASVHVPADTDATVLTDEGPVWDAGRTEDPPAAVRRVDAVADGLAVVVGPGSHEFTVR